jgi:hypothetical protein
MLHFIFLDMVLRLFLFIDDLFCDVLLIVLIFFFIFIFHDDCIVELFGVL